MPDSRYYEPFIHPAMRSYVEINGRDVKNDNGEHLVRTTEDTGMTIANTFFSTPKGDAWCLDYISTRHEYRRLVRKTTVFRVVRSESDHSIAVATNELRGRFDPNGLKRPANRHPRIDRKNLVNNDTTRRDLTQVNDSELSESPVSPTG